MAHRSARRIPRAFLPLILFETEIRHFPTWVRSIIDRFLILDHETSCPDAERVIFCDGSGGKNSCDDRDLDLSHWRPNRTRSCYKADTSTEICFRFLDDPIPAEWTLAVNNHLDVDGLLSVYTLAHSNHALGHRHTIVRAAEMGDFWGWGEQQGRASINHK